MIKHGKMTGIMESLRNKSVKVTIQKEKGNKNSNQLTKINIFLAFQKRTEMP